ncbi:uncharacterized protein LOC111346428 [Stylophora pistillata]|uniref:uncharacterized protein LOC111346428 n=1 Tax=Stylophora pistillata TaxID=50429 RepID=UPI000C0485B6|nr:uncharacterized protein LOC111346428 [Stylophora pistillata]
MESIEAVISSWLTFWDCPEGTYNDGNGFDCTVPGKPEVFVEQPKTAVVVSWKIKDKNGILKEYYVTSVRKDDLSKTQTLVTKKMEMQFDLKAEKTYEFQMVIRHSNAGGVYDCVEGVWPKLREKVRD